MTVMMSNLTGRSIPNLRRYASVEATMFRIFRTAEIFIAAGLDLYDDQLPVFFGNNVNFLFPRPPVAVPYPVPFFHEVECRKVFAFFSQFIMCRHRQFSAKIRIFIF